MIAPLGIPAFVLTMAGTYAATLFLVGLLMKAEKRSRQRAVRRSQRDATRRTFGSVARQLGLQAVDARKAPGPRLEGRIEGIPVSVASTWHAPSGWLTTIAIEPAPALPQDVWIDSHWRSRAAPPQPGPLSTELDCHTSDPHFDALLRVGGRAPTVHAVLNASSRQALMALARQGALRARDGRLVHETLEWPWSTERLSERILQTLKAAQALLRVSDVQAALTDAVRDDPVPGVRARCLTTLLAEFPDDPRTPATLEAALADDADAVRVVAATALGERGLPVLREVALRSDAEDELRARAIAVLGRHLPSDQIIAILDGTLDRKPPTIALAALGALGHVGDEPAVHRLLSMLQNADQDLQVAAAGALADSRSALAEPALIAALDSIWPTVQRTAAIALGSVGGVTATVRLREMAEDSATESKLRSLARQALAAIHSRLPDATPGQLSLSTGDSGQVSLVDDAQGGRLSIARRGEMPRD